MFTIKLYSENGSRQRIYEADSFTILRQSLGATNGPCPEWAEITLHRKSGDDIRCDVGDSEAEPSGGRWDRAIIENAAGRTTEMVSFGPKKLA